MADSRTFPFMVDWLESLGYSPDTRMGGKIAEWMGWYNASNDWYSYETVREFSKFTLKRDTLNPAALVAEAWSDLLMNEKLDIKSDDEEMTGILDEHFAGFGVGQADFTALSFGEGTGAWAIRVDKVSDDGMLHPDAEIGIDEAEAPNILPLTWSDNDCTQCAFATRVEIGGKDYDQCQAHVLKDGTYHILTQLFDVDRHSPVTVEGVIADLDTKSAHPTFALVKPAVPNMNFSHCAMGASVFSKGISAIKAVDEALTSFLVHMRVGRPKVFVSETMIKKQTKKGADGKSYTIYSAFGEADDIVFRTAPTDEGKQPMTVVQPEMRIAENEQAINAGLKMLSLTCGLGDNYWSWDHKNGLKTATEVVSDSSMLARSLRKHQNALEKSITRIVRGVAGVAHGIKGYPVDPNAAISIDFDDSVITDVQTDKNVMMSEIAAGLVPKWVFAKTFYNLSEEEARRWVEDIESAGDWA